MLHQAKSLHLEGFFLCLKSTRIAINAQILFNSYMIRKRLAFKGGSSNVLARTITSTKFIVSIATVLLAAIFVAWQYHNVTNPDRLFWGSVNNSLQTMSYTRHSTIKQGQQSVDQVIATTAEPKQRVFGDTVFTQTGVDSATAKTENIGTPVYDYVRYTSIVTGAQGERDGKPLDFSSVLNIWGKTQPDDTSITQGQLYNQSVLGVFPTGNLTAAQRHSLVKHMKDNKAYSYKVVETRHSGLFRRPTYTFSVTVNPVPYITAIQEFAKETGLTHLDGINPSDYEQASQLFFSVSIDGWSHQVTQTAQSAGSKTEDISGRNLRKELPAPPKDAISVDELQAQLQSIE